MMRFYGTGRHDVEVNVNGVGNALMQVTNIEERSMIFLPTLESVSPNTGSRGGGATLTISVSDNHIFIDIAIKRYKAELWSTGKPGDILKTSCPVYTLACVN